MHKPLRSHSISLFAGTWALIAAAALVALVSPLPAAPTRSAGETYAAYVEAVKTMTSLASLRPFLTKEMGQVMTRMPRDLQLKMVQQVRKDSVSTVKVVNETRLGDAYILELEGMRQGRNVKGWARMIVEEGEFKVAKDDWTGTPPPAAPKIPESVAGSGKAAGELTANGKTAQLLYAYARAVPYAMNPSKTAFEVTLSDAPLTPSDSSAAERIKTGSLHFIRLTIGPDKQVTEAVLFHNGLEEGVLNGPGGAQHKFEAQQFGPGVISGKAYLEMPDEVVGQTYYYAATFKANVVKSK